MGRNRNRDPPSPNRDPHPCLGSEDPCFGSFPFAARRNPGSLESLIPAPPLLHLLLHSAHHKDSISIMTLGNWNAHGYNARSSNHLCVGWVFYSITTHPHPPLDLRVQFLSRPLLWLLNWCPLKKRLCRIQCCVDPPADTPLRDLAGTLRRSLPCI